MFRLPELNYDYSALEPTISRQIMELHHKKHHQGYVDKLNQALDGLDHSKDIESILRNLGDLPEEKQQVVRNQGGGHLNHSLFWQWMSPRGGGQPSGELGEKINQLYGSFDEFKKQFSEAATSLFGSGWVWLMPSLEIVSTKNQDNPVMEGKELPILGLDVWEHAYYLDYQNKRDRYIEKWWDVINWSEVEKRFVSGIIS